jgi:hypothetical protein
VEPVSRSPEAAEGKRVRQTARKGLLEVRSYKKIYAERFSGILAVQTDCCSGAGRVAPLRGDSRCGRPEPFGAAEGPDRSEGARLAPQDKLREGSRRGRSSFPFEDSGLRLTRSGRQEPPRLRSE